MKQSTELQAILAAIPQDFASPEADYHAVRNMFAPFHGHPVREDLHIDIRPQGGVRCGHYHLKGQRTNQTVFYCHGGALVSCPLDDYHFYAEIIVRQTGCAVVMPDYQLAPEHPYPAAQDDCLAAYCGLLDSGTSAQEIVVVGESCGGGLGVAMMVQLRDKGLPLPAAFVSLTGWFDLSVAGPLPAGHDPFINAAWVRNRGEDYSGAQLPLNDPRISPAYANLQGLPPMFLQIGEYDAVREGALLLAENARGSGVTVVQEDWPGMPQGWHGLITAGVPEAAEAWRHIRHFVETLSR